MSLTGIHCTSIEREKDELEFSFYLKKRFIYYLISGSGDKAIPEQLVRCD